MDQTAFHKENITFAKSGGYEKIRRLLNFEKLPKLNILDVGSGSGDLGKKLLSLGQTVTGLDINPKAIVGGWVKEADVSQDWSVEPRSFDVVICCDVAEHLQDPVHVLLESKKVLKPGGKLIFGVPNHFDLRQRLRMFFGKGIVHWDNLRHNQTAASYGHIRFFTLTDLEKMFAQNGFFVEVLQLNFMGGGLIPTKFTPAFLRKLLIKAWPNLFSGKFIFLLSQNSQNPNKNGNKIIIPYTPLGL